MHEEMSWDEKVVCCCTLVYRKRRCGQHRLMVGDAMEQVGGEGTNCAYRHLVRCCWTVGMHCIALGVGMDTGVMILVETSSISVRFPPGRQGCSIVLLMNYSDVIVQ